MLLIIRFYNILWQISQMHILYAQNAYLHIKVLYVVRFESVFVKVRHQYIEFT